MRYQLRFHRLARMSDSPIVGSPPFAPRRQNKLKPLDETQGGINFRSAVAWRFVFPRAMR